jgi:hypothetical protein
MEFKTIALYRYDELSEKAKACAVEAEKNIMYAKHYPGSEQEDSTLRKAWDDLIKDQGKGGDLGVDYYYMEKFKGKEAIEERLRKRMFFSDGRVYDPPEPNRTMEDLLYCPLCKEMLTVDNVVYLAPCWQEFGIFLNDGVIDCKGEDWTDPPDVQAAPGFPGIYRCNKCSRDICTDDDEDILREAIEQNEKWEYEQNNPTTEEA